MLLTFVATAVSGGFGLIGAAKIAKTKAMVALAAHVGFTPEAYQKIGAAEVAGAIGVLVGLVWPAAGFVAGSLLLALLVGAVATHAKARDGLAAILPAMVFAAGCMAYLTLL